MSKIVFKLVLECQLEPCSTTFLALGTDFVEDNFSTDCGVGGWVQDDSSASYLLCTWKWKCQSLSCIWLFPIPWTIALQAPLSMGLPRQEHWSGLSFHPLGYLPDPGIKPRSPALSADYLPHEPTKVHLVKAVVFPVVVYGCESWTKRELRAEELMLLNCGVGENSWESLGLQGDPTSPS